MVIYRFSSLGVAMGAQVKLERNFVHVFLKIWSGSLCDLSLSLVDICLHHTSTSGDIVSFFSMTEDTEKVLKM